MEEIIDENESEATNNRNVFRNQKVFKKFINAGKD